MLLREPSKAAFDPESVDPETRQVNELVEAALAAVAPITTQQPAEIRAAREEGRGPFPPLVLSPEAEKRTIPGPGGEIGLRIFRRPAARAVYFHIHGGGWTLGRAHHQDPLLVELADAVPAAVVSVDYRLAPEHPYPAGPDDCEAAALWLVENAKRELGTDRLLIGGESAGAHLSVVTLLRLRDRHGYRGFAAANLIYGCYDLQLTPSVRRWGERNLILSTPIVEWFANQFVPLERRGDPDVSPLHADLRGLPPALFTVGTLDPLLDDSLFMHARWLAAGNEAELAISPDSIHAFNGFPHRAASEANENAHAFLRARLGSPGQSRG
ncbi:MAG: alpha/beta hydrolase [Deltaproteobacteria bacterium]|nr:alpha/beta hydrolase [Deltaproteobacteria bacterium]